MEEGGINKDMQVFETEGYKAGSEYGMKIIVYKQLQKCIDEGSKEMTRGGKITRIIDGIPIDIAVPNQREIYINSCEHLKLLILSHIKLHENKIKEFMKVNDFIKLFEGDEIKLKKQCEGDVNKIYKEHSKYSIEVQAKYEHVFNVDIQRVNDIYEEGLVSLYKTQFMRMTPALLSKTNFFGED